MDILRGSTCPEQKILYNMSNPCRSHILLQPHNQARIFSQTYKERNKMYWSLFPIQCVPGSNWLHKRWQHGGDVRDVCDVLSQCPRAVVDCPNMVSALSLTSSIQRCIFNFNKWYVNFFIWKTFLFELRKNCVLVVVVEYADNNINYDGQPLILKKQWNKIECLSVQFAYSIETQ